VASTQKKTAKWQNTVKWAIPPLYAVVSSLFSIDDVMICVLFAEWSLVRQKFVGYRLSIQDLLEQNLGGTLRPVFFLAARETLQPFVLIIFVSFRVYSIPGRAVRTSLEHGPLLKFENGSSRTEPKQ
jgi:hypothetical protein